VIKRLAIPLLFVLIALPAAAQLTTAKKVLKLMGTRFEIRAIHEDSIFAEQGVQAGIAEIQRIEKLISSWDPASQTSAINRQAGIAAVQVDPELFELIRRSIKVSQLTGGAFDISFAAIEPIWIFDRKEQDLPPPDRIAASVQKINFQHIILDAATQSVFLKEKGMRIGFGAIGKGYAANQAMKLMQAKGITQGVVNASGDLICWGQQADGNAWEVAIEDPEEETKVIARLTIGERALVTSGDYEKYFLHQGQRFSHIINPKTGYPTTGIKSVSVLCPDAELADALATAIFVLGKEKGLDLINRLKNIECLIIDDHNELTSSRNLPLDNSK